MNTLNRLVNVLAILVFLLVTTASANDSKMFEMRKTLKSYYDARGPMSPDRTKSVQLLGGAVPGNGDFQLPDGTPDWEGWTSVDRSDTVPPDWNVSEYNAANLDVSYIPNHAWWCGREEYLPCSLEDLVGGYGNQWDSRLDWFCPPSNQDDSVIVTVEAILNYDIEPGYDILYLQYKGRDGMVNVAEFTGNASAEEISVTFEVTTQDYVNIDNNDNVYLRWYFSSDGGVCPTVGASPKMNTTENNGICIGGIPCNVKVVTALRDEVDSITGEIRMGQSG